MQVTQPLVGLGLGAANVFCQPNISHVLCWTYLTDVLGSCILAAYTLALLQLMLVLRVNVLCIATAAAIGAMMQRWTEITSAAAAAKAAPTAAATGR